MSRTVKALVLTGYGLNCDYETAHALKTAGAGADRIHINQLTGQVVPSERVSLADYQILVFDGGFAWGDDHGAGVLLASRLKNRIGEEVEEFIERGNLIIGICNGFQAMVNLGLLPGFDGRYSERKVALIANDCGNFRNQWVRLEANESSPCVFTRGIGSIDLPMRHGEGKFYAEGPVLERIVEENLVALRYGLPEGGPANGRFPANPNGSLHDIAGITDPTGRIFGLMPHPEAYNSFTNHPGWTRTREMASREGKRAKPKEPEGEGIKIFRNAVAFAAENLAPRSGI